jgi:hypothetical protein
MTTTFLQRVDSALAQGRAAAELARRFLATNARRERREPDDDLLPDLLRLASERVELSTGYRYLFDNHPGLIGYIAAAIEHERQGGRGLRFHITVQANRGPVTLEVSGPGEARAFLAALDAPDPERARAFALKLEDERRQAFIRSTR